MLRLKKTISSRQFHCKLINNIVAEILTDTVENIYYIIYVKATFMFIMAHETNKLSLE